MDLLDPGIEPASPVSLALQANFLSPESSEKPICVCNLKYIFSKMENFNDEENRIFIWN